MGMEQTQYETKGREAIRDARGSALPQRRGGGTETQTSCKRQSESTLPEHSPERETARDTAAESVEAPSGPTMAKNLLKNPCGEEQLEFWELTENGGSEWHVEEMPGDCGHDYSDETVTKYFATSFE
ncbi:hypothetical protein GJAV_G00169970 [Gymnothorax javanicus]|nr:hypothetical protein GJAV_G00169970 [Gymnothorax javanicus]